VYELCPASSWSKQKIARWATKHWHLKDEHIIRVNTSAVKPVCVLMCCKLVYANQEWHTGNLWVRVRACWISMSMYFLCVYVCVCLKDTERKCYGLVGMVCMYKHARLIHPWMDTYKYVVG
jgi:hypothetical protein